MATNKRHNTKPQPTGFSGLTKTGRYTFPSAVIAFFRGEATNMFDLNE